MMAGASSTWGTITATIEAALGIIGAIVDAVAALIEGDWQAFGDAIRAGTDASWAAVEARFGTAATTVRNFIETAAAAIGRAWNAAMSAIQSAVSIATTAIDTLKGAAQSFWNWLKDKVFSFQINLPELPDWLTPGSPFPLHTAWVNFARDLNRMVVRPQVDFEGLGPALAPIGNGTAAAGPTVVNQYFNNREAAALGLASVKLERRARVDAWMGRQR
jgi:hypothetical protein